MKILLATNNLFGKELQKGFMDIGCEAYIGFENLYVQGLKFDLIILFWPEEILANWLPTQTEVAAVVSELSRRKEAGEILAYCVNNIVPHASRNSKLPDSILFLYEWLSVHADFFGHFSHAAREAYLNRFGKTNPDLNFVHGAAAYEVALTLRGLNEGHPRTERRGGTDLRIAVVGAIRLDREMRILRLVRSFASRTRGCTLYIACRDERPAEGYLKSLSRLAMRKVASILGRNSRQIMLSDYELRGLLAATDVLVICRADQISSGLPLLAASAGVLPLMPRMGSLEEYFDHVASEPIVFYDKDDPCPSLGMLAELSEPEFSSLVSRVCEPIKSRKFSDIAAAYVAMYNKAQQSRLLRDS